MDAIRTLGKYELRATLGKGAMGTVYDGWDPAIARRVAIKTVSLPADPDPETAEELARFRREAQAAGRLTHPNIVAIYDYGETSDLAYIVMEFVDGPTLKAALNNHEGFALSEVQRLMDDVLAGLQYSHDRGVVHRDIKPANIMLTSERRAKIADFGIARIETSSMTQTGTMLGTPAYMSPEQFTGQVVDARTDVYSAGVVLYQLLTGERPFEGGLTAIMHKVLNTDPPAPSEIAVTVPSSMDAVVRRAMAKRPDDRYPSAAAFAEAIRGAVTASPPVAGDDEDATFVAPARPAARARSAARPVPPDKSAPVPDPASGRSRVPALLIGAGIAALLGLGAGGWFLFGTSTETPSPPLASVVVARKPVLAPRMAHAAPSPAAIASSEPTGGADQAPGAAATSPHPATDEPGPAGGTAPPVRAAGPTLAPSPAQAAVQATEAEPTKAAAEHPPPTQTPAASAPKPLTSASQVPGARTSATPPATSPATSDVPDRPGQPLAAPQTLPQQVAIDLGAARRLVGQALASSSCALGAGVVQDNGMLAVSGYASADAASSLRQALPTIPGGSLTWQMREVDPVFCAALSLLRPIAAQGGAPASGLALSLANGVTALRDGERILPRITMGDFAGEVRVDYLGHDGSVMHLYPNAADPAAKVTARSSRRLRPGEMLSIGDPGPGRPIWVAGPPYGTDMIMLVASSSPLLARTPVRNEEDHAAQYMRELESAIARVRGAGGRVAGTLLLLDTLPK